MSILQLFVSCVLYNCLSLSCTCLVRLFIFVYCTVVWFLFILFLWYGTFVCLLCIVLYTCIGCSSVCLYGLCSYSYTLYNSLFLWFVHMFSPVCVVQVFVSSDLSLFLQCMHCRMFESMICTVILMLCRNACSSLLHSWLFLCIVQLVVLVFC